MTQVKWFGIHLGFMSLDNPLMLDITISGRPILILISLRAGWLMVDIHDITQ